MLVFAPDPDVHVQSLGFCGTDPSPSRITPVAARVLVKSPLLLHVRGFHHWKLTPARGLKVSACRRRHTHDSHCPGSHDSCCWESCDCPCQESQYKFIGSLGVACGITSAAVSALIEARPLLFAHCDTCVIMPLNVREFLSSGIYRLQQQKQGHKEKLNSGRTLLIIECSCSFLDSFDTAPFISNWFDTHCSIPTLFAS